MLTLDVTCIPVCCCRNENVPCGVGGSRCRQVTRAHWSLVWTAGTGVNLVAHEVPSHCECLNLGAAHMPLRSSQAGQASSRGGEFGVAGLKMDGIHEDLASPDLHRLPLPVPSPSPNPSTGPSSSPSFTDGATSLPPASFATSLSTDTSSAGGTTTVTDQSSPGLK